MGRSRREESDHNKEVLRLAKHYSKEGFDVKADLVGWPSPKKINGRKPDIIATKEFSQRTKEGNIFPRVKKIIIEVETVGSVNDPHAKSQAIAFRKAEREEADTEFILKIA